MHRRTLLPVVAVLLLGTGSSPEETGDISLRFSRPPVPDRMRSLDFLVGEWTATVEFFEPGGRRSGTLGSRTVVEPIFDGMMLQQEGTLEGTPMRTLSHYLIDRNSGMITWTALDSLGGHHIFHGGFENRELVLISDPVKTSDRTLLFKRIDRRIDANAYEFSMYTSSDNGTTWTLGNRQVNRRVAPPSGH